MKNSANLLLLASLISPTAYASSINGFDISFSGFIKTSANAADAGLASFNNINMTAPTHAVAQKRPQDKSSRFSFQTQQTRIGSTLTKNNVMGKVEFDFVDFSKSSPTTQMVPRVRIALMSYTFEDYRVQVGQDWDLYSPVNQFTFNHVGNYFMAGNTGFMRQQAQVHRKSGDWETSFALGMAGSNPGVSDADLELGKSPTYAGRVTKNLKDGKIGVSAIYTTLNYERTNNSRRDSYGYNFFYDKKYGAITVRTEAYYGQSLANIGTLAIGKGTNTRNVREWGGVSTLQYNLTDTKMIFGGAGLTKADNKSEVTAFSLVDNVITNPGVRSNFVSRVGYEWKLTSDLSWISEVTRFETQSKINDDKYETQLVYSLESGFQLRF